LFCVYDREIGFERIAGPEKEPNLLEKATCWLKHIFSAHIFSADLNFSKKNEKIRHLPLQRAVNKDVFLL